MANYLVTGAAGFIGGAIAKKLLSEGNSVVSIDNLSTGRIDNVPKGVVFFEGDCANIDLYSKIPQRKYDAIFHIAGQSSGEISFDDPIYDIRTNAESTLMLLKFALNNGCKRFVFASTMSVYGRQPDEAIAEKASCKPESFYGVGKLASEHYMRIYQQYGINSTSLRLFNVYGPGQNLDNLRQGMVSIYLAQMLKGSCVLVKGSPDRYRDFINIRNVVEVFIKCLDCQGSYGKEINVATGRRTTVREVIETLSALFDKKIIVEYSGSTSGDVHGIYGDNRLMKSLFNIKEMIEFKDGARDMYSASLMKYYSN